MLLVSIMHSIFGGDSLLMCITTCVITAWNLACHDYEPLLYSSQHLLVTWSPVNSVWDSKGPNLIPDHIIQLLLHLCRGLRALSQDHIRINALPLDVVVNPASSSY